MGSRREEEIVSRSQCSGASTHLYHSRLVLSCGSGGIKSLNYNSISFYKARTNDMCSVVCREKNYIIYSYVQQNTIVICFEIR